MTTYESRRGALDFSMRYQYNNKVTSISTRTMYETDYEFAYEHNNELYTYDLDEMCEYMMRDIHTHIPDAYEIDDEYARDSCDYNEMAYRHYA